MTDHTQTRASLADRYIHAALRTAPAAERADLELELRASIGDAVDARVEGGELPADAERATLIDLGDPTRLAARYLDRPTSLLGPEYYFDWLRLTRILLVVILPTSAVGVALGQILTGGTVGDVASGVVTTVLTVGVHLVFWSTLAFVIVERSAAPQRSGAERGSNGPTGQWTPDRLPEITARGEGFADLIASIVATGAVAGFVFWQQHAGVTSDDAGRPVPILQQHLWQAYLPALFLVLAAAVVVSVVRYRLGRPTFGIVIVSAVLLVAGYLPGIVLLLRGELIEVRAFGGGVSDPLWQTVSVLAAVALTVILVWSIIDVVLRWRRSGRSDAVVPAVSDGPRER